MARRFGQWRGGSTIPNIDTYLLPIIAVIVIVSLIPIGLELLRTRFLGGGQHPVPA